MEASGLVGRIPLVGLLGVLLAALMFLLVAFLAIWRSSHRAAVSLQRGGSVVKVLPLRRAFDPLDGSELHDPVEIPLVGPRGIFFAFVNCRNAVRYHRLRARGFERLRIRPAPSRQNYMIRRGKVDDAVLMTSEEWSTLWWGNEQFYPTQAFVDLDGDPASERGFDIIMTHLVADHPDWDDFADEEDEKKSNVL